MHIIYKDILTEEEEMNNKKIGCIFLFSGFLMVSSGSYGQQPIDSAGPGRSLTLEQCIQYALKHQQFNYILEDAQKRSAADLSVIAGDLNTFRLFRARPSWQQLEDAANTVGFRDITTEILWTRSESGGRLKQKLDAIFIQQPRAVPYRSWSLEIPGSDHIPVFADLRLAS